ncbi:MAG: EAL domain-containing protein [Woeseia sp.]|nr:EAL domain-containing protein [Woeseia sp.]MBT8095830.1 EAL domain-containing protein [Woeseia sp.]NNE61720.1 EAL domain-containing protein [Woeseia sp.]NNL55084.1 EAL domain-containing protein [Woeseia sp.]
MTGNTLPRYLFPVLALASVVAVVALASFYLQYRMLADELVQTGFAQHEQTLAASFERRFRARLHNVADRIQVNDSDADRRATADILRDMVAARDEFVGLRYLAVDGTILESGELPESFEQDATQWQSQQMYMTYPVVRDGERFGVLLGNFDLGEFWADANEFRDNMLAAAADYRRQSMIWEAVALVLILVSCVLIIWRVNRNLNRRIHELKIQAEKLSSADFGEALDSSEDDELGQLTAEFNRMRNHLKETTMSRNYVDSILSGMNEAIIVTTEDQTIKKINNATSRMLGYQEEELVGQPLKNIVSEKRGGQLVSDTQSGIPKESLLIAKSGDSIPISYTGSSIDDDEGRTDHIFAAQNITERRKAEQRIRYLARIDALTKIPNRMQFQHLLQRAIARAKRSQQKLAIFYIDVDRFKEINDTFGHLAGDTTLETVAERLAESLPADAVIGRLAGDEFAVIVDEFDETPDDHPKLDQLAREVLDRLADPFYVQGHEVFMTASLGIACYPHDAPDVIDLIRNADAALYSAKKSGGNVFANYNPAMNEAAVERLMTKSKLKRAFERDELLVHYQPKYNIVTGQVIGAEALVRWELPERGIILPSDFIPIAEETNLIIELGEWVLDKVCEDFRFWQRSVPSPGRVSVNLSLKQLRQPNFIGRISNILRSYQVSPTSLELEITETTLMENPTRTIKLLDELYGLGLHLAIDDFGTGYSSLSALQQFPISTLKIDKSFVRDVSVNPDDATIVATIVHMGRSLKMDVVAEGVETEQQLNFLQSLDCTYVQGLLFGDPMSSDNYLELLLSQLDGTDKHRALFA